MNQGNSNDSVLDTYGEDDMDCVDSEFQPYDGTKKRCGVYSGKQSANYVYRALPYEGKIFDVNLNLCAKLESFCASYVYRALPMKVKCGMFFKLLVSHFIKGNL